MSPKAPQNPFPGPQPYRASDRGRFYGREAVSQELTDTILAHRCVALYGPSGAGKSSVMQAGVIPALEEAHDFRFVAIDGWPADETPVAWLLYTLISALKLVPPEGELGLFESVEWIVRQAFRRSDRPILIYLDQLEQLLLPSREVASVEAFLDWLDRFAERPLRGLHLVLSMREDYLGRFRDRARGRQRLLEDGMRLGPMTVGEIVGAVVRTAADGDTPQTWSAGPMRALMMQVRIPGQRESDDAEVQTAFAQIVCRALFGERAAAGGLEGDTPVHAEPILFRYLENTLEALGPLRAPAERLLEDHLIAADGTRTLLTEEAARASGLAAGEQLDTLLHELERAAILRAEQHRGTRYFELGHDWLAKKVFDRKQERAARLAEAAREAVRAAELLAAKAETRRARRVVAVVTAFALVAVGLGIVAWTQKQLAVAAEQEARAAEQEAIAAQQRAEAERERAEEAEKVAVSARDRAEAERLRAEREKERAEAEKERAESEKERAEAEKERAEDAEQTAVRQKTLAERARERAVAAEGDALRQKERAVAEARRASDANRLAVALGLLEDDPTVALALLRDVEDPAGTRGWIPAAALALRHPASLAVLRSHEAPLVAALMSADGALVATASEDRRVLLSHVDGSTQPIELGQHPAPLVDLELSPDGRTVAAAAADGSLRLYPRSGGPALVLQDSGPPITDLAFSPDGRHLAIATRTGESRLYPAAGGPPRLLAGHEGAARALAFSPKAGWIASVGDDGAARLWRVDDPAAPPIVLRGHRGAVYSLAFSPDGERLVTAGDDRSARIWRPRDPTAAPIVLTHPDAVYAAEFSPKGDRLVTAARDRTVRVWSADRGGKPLELSGHTDKIYRARFDPRGERVASASRDGTARVWRLADPTQPRVLRGHTGPVIDVSFSGDGRRLVSASADGSARVWSAADERRERILRGAPGPVSSASLSADGRWAIATAGARARAWPLSGSAAAIEFDAGASPALSAAILGDRAYTAHEDGALRIWRLTPRRAELTRTVELGLAGRPSFVVVSPDGRRALAGLADRAFIVDLDTRARVELRGHQGAVLHGAFSPDGARVITASDDRSARIWPTAGGAPILLRGHEGAVYSALFSPDGARVVTASWDRSARVWSAAGGPALVVLAGHEAEVRDAAFSPDGARVITASDDRTAKIWRSDGSGDVVTLYGHDGPVHSAAFSADGERAITGAVDRSVRIWPANFDDPQLLRGQIDAATTVCLQPEERRALLGEAPEDAAERSHACEARAGR
jgi:WD40 repeat protein